MVAQISAKVKFLSLKIVSYWSKHSGIVSFYVKCFLVPRWIWNSTFTFTALGCRWYTSMVGRKSNLKFLISKLWEVGVLIVKTTEFVQGQTSRWGLAWSFVPPVRKTISLPVAEKSNVSFMLEVWILAFYLAQYVLLCLFNLKWSSICFYFFFMSSSVLPKKLCWFRI